MPKCFCTGKECLRDFKWDLGIFEDPLCSLHRYRVCCRVDQKQQRALNYTYCHHFCNKTLFLVVYSPIWFAALALPFGFVGD